MRNEERKRQKSVCAVRGSGCEAGETRRKKEKNWELWGLGAQCQEEHDYRKGADFPSIYKIIELKIPNYLTNISLLTVD